MPDTTAQGYRIAVDPDGVPCTLVDIAGDEVTGTLWGAVRAGGAFALILTEHDHFAHTPVPPTAGMMRALGDALDDDPENPHMTEGSRLWWKEEAARLRGMYDGATRRADDLAADVEQCQASIRQYAADADGLREQHAVVNAERGELKIALERTRAELDRARRQLAVRMYGDGMIRLARADEWVRTRRVERARAAALVRLTAAAALAVGYVIGRGIRLAERRRSR